MYADLKNNYLKTHPFLETNKQNIALNTSSFRFRILVLSYFIVDKSSWTYCSNHVFVCNNIVVILQEEEGSVWRAHGSGTTAFRYRIHGNLSLPNKHQ